MNMKIEPIEIDVDGDKIYAQIAYFIDNPLISRTIQRLKRDYNFQSPLPYDLDALKNFFIRLAGFNPKHYNYHLPVQAADELVYLFSDLENLFDFLFKDKLSSNENEAVAESIMKIKSKLLNDIADTRRLFFYPKMFDSVVFQTIAFNKVRFFKSAYPTMIDSPISYSEIDTETSAERDILMAIIVIPTSTKEDILGAFEYIQQNLRNEVESVNPLIQTLDKHPVWSVKRDRDWYWLKENGMTYPEIVTEWNKLPNLHEKDMVHGKRKKMCRECLIDDQNVIEQAVKRYRDMLKIIS